MAGAYLGLGHRDSSDASYVQGGLLSFFLAGLLAVVALLIMPRLVGWRQIAAALLVAVCAVLVGAAV